MPIPKPRKDEDKESYIKRCMSNSVMNDEYPKRDRRFAICNTQWRKRKKEELLEAFCSGDLEREAILTAELEEKQYNCECLDCGHKVTSDKHCRDYKCPKCGGEMRRTERPGIGSRS